MANKYVRSYTESIIELGYFVDLVMAGFSSAKVAQEMAEFVERERKRRGEESSQSDVDAQKKRYDELSEFSDLQESRGFPYLFTTASVRLWSILEAFIDDVLEFMLMNIEPQNATSELLGIRGNLLEFSMMDSQDQASYLLNSVKDRLSSRLKHGVGRFENPLRYVGLYGGVNDIVRDSLFELSEVRNIIVHKNSIADDRLAENCSWMNINVGEHVDTNHEDYQIYVKACFWYLVEIGERMRDRFPDLPIEYKDDASRMRGMQVKLVQNIESLWESRKSEIA